MSSAPTLEQYMSIDTCLVYWEEGLGCVLIKSTLGPGNPGGEELGGGEDTRMQRGTRG
jgi:hypothetical protein